MKQIFSKNAIAPNTWYINNRRAIRIVVSKEAGDGDFRWLTYLVYVLNDELICRKAIMERSGMAIVDVPGQPLDIPDEYVEMIKNANDISEIGIFLMI